MILFGRLGLTLSLRCFGLRYGRLDIGVQFRMPRLFRGGPLSRLGPYGAYYVWEFNLGSLRISVWCRSRWRLRWRAARIALQTARWPGVTQFSIGNRVYADVPDDAKARKAVLREYLKTGEGLYP